VRVAYFYAVQDIVYPFGKLKGLNVFKVVYRRHTNFAMESIEQTLKNEGFKSDPLNRFESLVGGIRKRTFVRLCAFLLRHCQSPGKPLEPLLPKHIGNDLLAQRKNCGTVITQADWVIRSQPLTHLKI